MDEIWERAVEAALGGESDHQVVRALTLDGAVKCVQGRLPPPGILERFQNLQHLSIANTGVSSLQHFPRLRNLQKLILSDNRIAGGLEFLVEAGLDSLRDLDLSNNRIQSVEDLAPLAQMKLVSLDLYECPVTRGKDYRPRVFRLIRSLKYLDKMDAEGIERPESDDEDEEEDEEDEDDQDVEEDPGSGEIDGEDRLYSSTNGHSERLEGVLDEEEGSDAEDEEAEKRRAVNGTSHQSNGFHVQAVDVEDDGEGSESGEEIDEEDGNDDDDDDDGDDDDSEDDDVVEVHEIDDSDNEEDGVDDEDDDVEDEEGVENVDGNRRDPWRAERLMSAEGEIDGHEQGEDDEDGDGETGEDEQGVNDAVDFEDEEEDAEEDEDYGEGYLIQPVGQVVEEHGAVEIENVDLDDEEDDESDDDEEVEDDAAAAQVLPSTSSSSSHLKRKRDNDDDGDDDGDEDDVDDDDDGVDDEEDDS